MPVETPRHEVHMRPALAERAIGQCHARSVHQRVVFDALAQLGGKDAANWRRMFLGEAALLALGANAPDVEFRDFKNHVLFPRDDYWGGAIGRAQSWYQNLVTAIDNREWSNAAYCAGVLSHYVTDALHPFHTAQSEAENNIHFACDVTVEVTFAQLRTLADASPPALPLRLSDSPGFLAPAIAAGADAAHQSYEGLLAHFDLGRAVSDPASGFDVTGQRIMAGVIAAQVGLVAAVFDRAIRDAGAAAPITSIVKAGALAALRLPLTRLQRHRRVSDARQRIAFMFDEIRATGRATATLPEEERVKRDLYIKDIVAKRRPVSVSNVFPLDARRSATAALPDTPHSGDTDGRNEGDEATGEVIVLQRRRSAIDMPRPAPRWVKADATRSRVEVTATAEREPGPVMASGKQTGARAPTGAASALPATAGVGHAAAALLLPASADGFSNFRDRRIQTAEALSAAIPGVGPVDALILRAAGVVNADAFLAADADTLSGRMGPLPISPVVLRAWQARTQLMLAVPGLAGPAADLLIGSGYKTAAAIVDADAEKVCADILTYVTTNAGQKALSAGAPPDVAEVRAMIDAARAARAA